MRVYRQLLARLTAREYLYGQFIDGAPDSCPSTGSGGVLVAGAAGEGESIIRLHRWACIRRTRVRRLGAGVARCWHLGARADAPR